MKIKLILVLIFICSIFFIFYFSSLPVIQQTENVITRNMQLGKDGYPTGESQVTDNKTINRSENFSSIGGAIAFGAIAASSILGFSLLVRNKER